MRILFITTTLFAALLLSACLHEPIHQGNRLGGDEVFMIHEGDSKFSVEQKLGSPSLDSVLHPDRITYFEEFEDEESGKLLWRSVEIVYDKALRVKKITRTGFKEKK
ncbi:MAG: outer membrane protein assembly factor BamE [Mariprofundus sp.]|nr:outer membrane protein assembly factor BamE [Mariprofundus sp.]